MGSLWVLLLPFLLAGCGKAGLFSYLPRSLGGGTAMPLSEVLPGRWDITERGLHFTVHFGRHSEMSYVVDVPPEFKARLKLDQLWVGGNYHVNGDMVDMTFTDGRFATLLAQLRGLEVHHIRVVSFTEDGIVDEDKTTWRRIGSEPLASTGTARDLAAEASAGSSVATPEKAALSPPQNQRLHLESARLAAVYSDLEKRRRALNPKDSVKLAEFNKSAADYSAQVARLNTESSGKAAAGSSTPSVPSGTATTSPGAAIKAAGR